MGGPCAFRIPMTRPVCARGAPKWRPSMHGANFPPATPNHYPIRISRKRDVKRNFFPFPPFHVLSGGVARW